MDNAYELVKQWCEHCKAELLHEHGVTFHGREIIGEFFTCIKCDKTVRYKKERK